MSQYKRGCIGIHEKKNKNFMKRILFENYNHELHNFPTIDRFYEIENCTAMYSYFGIIPTLKMKKMEKLFSPQENRTKN